MSSNSPITITFTLDGSERTVTSHDVQNRLAGAAPEGGQKHFANVNGVWYPVLQAFEAAVQVPRERYRSSSARRHLAALGFQLHDNLSMPVTWDSVGLQAAGFVGFVTPAEIVDAAPDAAGVYLVVRTGGATPRFLLTSTGGQVDAHPHSYEIDYLANKWLPGQELIYIGAADKNDASRRGLATRLNEFVQFGSGRPAGHRGGRAVWQLADSDSLLVAWQSTRASQTAKQLKTTLLEAFSEAHGGKLPFANMKG